MMTVEELRKMLAGHPGHLLVYVETPVDGSGGGADVEFSPVDDVVIEGVPHHGRFVAIRTSGDVL